MGSLKGSSLTIGSVIGSLMILVGCGVDTRVLEPKDRVDVSANVKVGDKNLWAFPDTVFSRKKGSNQKLNSIAKGQESRAFWIEISKNEDPGKWALQMDLSSIKKRLASLDRIENLRGNEIQAGEEFPAAMRLKIYKDTPEKKLVLVDQVEFQVMIKVITFTKPVALQTGKLQSFMVMEFSSEVRDRSGAVHPIKGTLDFDFRYAE